MYCPHCATPNTDSAKFCRVCGTNLEAVGLALSDNRSFPIKSAGTAELTGNYDWLAKESAGKRSTVQGSVLLGVSLLIAMAAFIATRGRFVWFPIWTVFFGWVAGWGAISLALGLGRLIEAREMLRGFDSRPENTVFLNAGNEGIPPVRASITEHTTRHLEQRDL